MHPLIEDQNDGVYEALNVMKEYHLLREDVDSLVELSTWPGKKSPMDQVDGRVKAALTRAYNKEVGPYSYSAMSTVKKKRAAGGDDDYVGAYGDGGEGGDQASDSDDGDDDNVSNDALIKQKKSAAPKASTSKASTSKASTSKASSSAAGSKRAGTSKKK